MLSPALWKTQTAPKQVLERAASRGRRARGRRGATPSPGSGHHPGPEAGWGQEGEDGGAAGVGVGTRRPGPFSGLRSPGPHGCWTAPTPARPCPRRPPPPTFRGRAAGGPSPGPRTGAVGTRAAVPVAAAAPGQRRRRRQWRGRGAACALPAPGPVRGARPLSPGLPAPAQLSAPSPLTSYLSPPALTAPRTCFSGAHMRSRAPPAAPARPLAEAHHATRREGEEAVLGGVGRGLKWGGALSTAPGLDSTFRRIIKNVRKMPRSPFKTPKN